MLAIGIVVIISRRPCDPRLAAGFAVAVTWFLCPVLYHQFRSQGVVQFVPMHRLSRHLVVYAPGAMFAIIAGCALFAHAVRAAAVPRAQGPVMAAAIVLLVTHKYFNWRAEQIAHVSFHRIKNTYARIREHHPDDVRTISADPGDLSLFDFWLNPLGAARERMLPFSASQTCGKIHDGVVLTQLNPGWHKGAPVIQETLFRLPCLIDPPATWQQVYQGYPVKLFRVNTRERDARD